MNSVSADRQPRDRRRAEGRRAGQEGREFLLAVDRAGRDAGADFVSVSTWDRQAEVCGEYLAKGARVGVDGRLRSRSWEDADGKRRTRDRGRREPDRVPRLAQPRGGALRGGRVVGCAGAGPPRRHRRVRRRAARRRVLSGVRPSRACRSSAPTRCRRSSCGVSSSRELFERAGEAGAQLVLVHHGLFWRNEPLLVDRRLKGRLEALFAGEPDARSRTTSRSTRTRRSATTRCSPTCSAPTREGEFASIGAGARFDEPRDDRRAHAAARAGDRPRAARLRRGAGADRARRRRDRRRRHAPHRGCARGLRRARHRRAGGAGAARQRASSASTSSPAATTRPRRSA